MIPLIVKRTANCQGAAVSPKHKAAITKARQLATPMHACSRARYFPRMEVGINAVNQGNQAALEIPREILKRKSRKRMSDTRVVAFKKPAVIGTSAITKMKTTRVLQPPTTNFL